jgi:mannose-6-phosphate isomerase
LRFEPFLRPMPWGGRALEQWVGKRLPAGERIGESWEVSDHPVHRSVVASGGPAGMTLRHLMLEHRGALLGPAAAHHETFPWLIKFLDASENLSVQVHPDAEAVKALWPGEGAKNEAWLVLAARPSSRIYAGLRPGVGRERLREALCAGTAVECLHSFEPRPGDFVWLPAGTVHALGGGIVVAEIQQTSDATFRLFDWGRRDAHGRPRALHLDQGLASIRWHQGPVHATPTGPAESAGAEPRVLLHCPYFTIEAVNAAGTLSLGGQGRLQALLVAEGRAQLPHGEPLTAGQVWVFPACLQVTQLEVPAGLRGLLCTLP